MNFQHFKAFLWLRWRLRINQLKRAGTANAVLLGILAVALFFVAVGMFVTGLLVGLFVLPGAPPIVLLCVWDGVVVAFLFFWMIGLLTDLQRSEGLSLDKFLHLPVSLTSAFLINYLSSLFSLTLVVFVPGMLALTIALVFSKGPAMLVTLPLLATFLFMVTAVTYQFRNWLAALMANPRRRNTIIVVVTITFILLAQAPNLINIYQPWTSRQVKLGKQLNEEREELHHSLEEGKITRAEYKRQREQLDKDFQQQSKERGEKLAQQAESMVRFLSLILPPGWVGLGSMDADELNFLPALLGTLGLALIGTASLWRAYRTSLRLYTGQFTSGEKRAAPAAAPVKVVHSSSNRLLEKRLPWVSEQTSAIALASFRSLTRAPEAKMLILSPIIMGVVFGGLFLRAGDGGMSRDARPLVAFGITAMMVFSLVQLVGNQFGFDRGGFRVYVLCAASRRDILLGKNLAVAPLALVLAGLLVIVVQVVQPMYIDHFLAVWPQMISMFLIFCMWANLLSIEAPLHVPAGTMKPNNVKGMVILLHLLFLFLFPIAVTPLLLPLGVEVFVRWWWGISGVPLCLLLSLLECVVIVFLYRLVLGWQGRLLQRREQTILKIVTSKE